MLGLPAPPRTNGGGCRIAASALADAHIRRARRRAVPAADGRHPLGAGPDPAHARRVGDPHRAYRVLHVGGTNGKGSVAAHIESVLRRMAAASASTRRRTCARSANASASTARHREDALLPRRERLWPRSAGGRHRSSRRRRPSRSSRWPRPASTRRGRGRLGGRLDATNVVEPDVVVLTNVSLDHVQLLGPTIADVAREKAGIIKAGVPVVTGEVGPAAGTSSARARSRGAPLRLRAAGDDVRPTWARRHASSPARHAWGDLDAAHAAAGAHQAMNAALAVRRWVRCARGCGPGTPCVTGCATRWPGRLQVERVGGVTWVFDVAHNVAGVEALVAALRALPLPRPLTRWSACSATRTGRTCSAPLYGAADT
jgi:dihydrofolate synthase / folylpolyglutamate synthase